MIRIKSSKWDIEEAARYFFLCFGLINIALVILISIYLIIAGLPAIFEVGFFDFIFGTKWASAAAEPQFRFLIHNEMWKLMAYCDTLVHGMIFLLICSCFFKS